MQQIEPNMLYSTADAAEFLGVTSRTIINWVQSGKLPSKDAKNKGSAFHFILGSDILDAIEEEEAERSALPFEDPEAEELAGKVRQLEEKIDKLTALLKAICDEEKAGASVHGKFYTDLANQIGELRRD